MEKRIEEIVNLFTHRDQVVKQESKKIFENINHVISGIDSFLTSTDRAYDQGNISWEDVQYVEDNDVVVVFGMLSFIPGSKFELGGKVIDVTESNSAAFARMVRIGIPVALIAMDSEEEVIKFLGGIKQQNETIDQHNVTDLHSVAPFPQQKRDDFKWDKLTDEQRKSLIINDPSEKPN